MIKVYVDSASSIKQEEKQKYNVEIIPLRYLMGDIEYRDGIDLSIDDFYKKLIGEKLFPKTSLPNLSDLQEEIEKETSQGNKVVIVTLSSGISGTFSSISTMFAGNDNVLVVDSLSAVGGVRILVEEINKYRDRGLEVIKQRIEELKPRIKILAIPETLDYLLKGGRLSRKAWVVGKMFNIKPIISIKEGKVVVDSKKLGIRNAMKHIAMYLHQHCDENYSIVPSYTYNKENIDKLIEMTEDKYKNKFTEFDNLDPVIACHWGPNAFGYVFVEK